MSVHKEGESYSYWPGYVDALTNIVLNLLFLVAIFVIGVAALGLVAAQRKELPEGAVVSNEPQTVVERVKDVVRKIIVSSPVASGVGQGGAVEVDVANNSKPSVLLEKLEKQADATVIKLAFAQEAYVINKAEEVAVLKQLSAVLQVSGKKILIWTAAPPDDALLVRGGMTRLLSVRNMLLRHGVAPELVDVRMVSQSPTAKTTGHVFIEINKEDGHVEKK
jgi:hypothetical protein